MCWMNCVPGYGKGGMRALEIVFRILWSVVLGGLIYGSAIWLLRVELSGDIERMEPGKAWLLGDWPGSMQL